MESARGNWGNKKREMVKVRGMGWRGVMLVNNMMGGKGGGGR